jgi:endonuclease YncB( thermonuclease family)
MITRRRFLATGAAFVSVTQGGWFSSRRMLAHGAPVGLPVATPIEALDGEKLRVDLNGERQIVRLIGLDAPEPEVNENTTECGFAESRQALLDSVTGRTLLLEPDAEDKDGKDRLWRHVWLVNADGSDGGLLNEQLLLNGWVTTREEEKNTKYAERYAKAAADGRASGANLYTACTSFHQEIPRYGGHDAPAQPGEAVSVKGVRVSLDSYYYSYSDALGTAPKGGYMYLIIAVTIVNERAEGKYNYNEMKFAAKNLDSDADYDDEFAFLDAPLGSGELSPGEYVSGQVALEIQETAVNVRLKYNVEGDYSLYWLTPPV